MFHNFLWLTYDVVSSANEFILSFFLMFSVKIYDVWWWLWSTINTKASSSSFSLKSTETIISALNCWCGSKWGGTEEWQLDTCHTVISITLTLPAPICYSTANPRSASSWCLLFDFTECHFLSLLIHHSVPSRPSTDINKLSKCPLKLSCSWYYLVSHVERVRPGSVWYFDY